MLHEFDQKYRYRFVVTLNFFFLFKNKFLVYYSLFYSYTCCDINIKEYACKLCPEGTSLSRIFSQAGIFRGFS
jgi:hypothetical protein